MSLHGDVSPELAATSAALPRLPLLASTQFCMDVLLCGPVLDLHSLIEILHVDPVALLRLFQALAEELPCPADRPARLGEIVVALGRDGLDRALGYAPSTWAQQAALSAFAADAVALGRAAQELAAALGLGQEEAYLRGLLHGIGHLPALLGWTSANCTGAEAWAAVLALDYHLPATLVSDPLAAQHEETEALWPALLLAARAHVGQAAGAALPSAPAHRLS